MGVAKISVDTGYKKTLDWKQGTSSSDTTSQSFGLTQHIVEEPKSCTRACVLATEGEATVPYTMSGSFTGKLKNYESWVSDEDAFVCCYLRNGGAHDCNVLGHSGAGWATSAWPGMAVAHGTCPAFGYKGYSATYTAKGNFKASMDFEADVTPVLKL